jgi:hypothetical protein
MLALAACAPAAGAQQVVASSSVSGRVEDSRRTPIPGAAVSLLETETNLRLDRTSDERGRFRFSAVPPGYYRIELVKEGFLTVRATFRAMAGRALEIPVTMAAPSASENLTVTAAPAVDTARTELAENVTREEIQKLPLNGRNYVDLALLVPGVSRTNTGTNQRFAETSAVAGMGLSISSQRNLNNGFVVDGLSANDDAAELAGTSFSEDVIREFQVVRSGGIAEYGHSTAGVISVVTQSGTNTLRGDGYGFFRDDALDAKNALAASPFAFSRQQYGASLSGPAVRDRTFFFGNFEQLREKSASVVTITPGDVALINDRFDAAAYRGPRISTGTIATTLDTTNWFGRLDQFLSNSDQLNVRYSRYEVSSANARGIGGLNDVSRAAGLGDTDQTVAASNIWTVSPALLNETRARWTRSNLDAPTNDVVGPAVTISGVANIGVATSSPTLRDTEIWQAVGSLSLLTGSHSVKGGIDYLFNRVRIEFPGALQGVYTFRNMADFLAGRYTSYQQAFGVLGTTQDNSNVGAYVQDEWRLTSRLTVNAGLRYDVQYLARLVHTDTNNVSPRLGIAWDPEGNGKSVVRATAGLFYSPIPLRALANALQRDGVAYRVALVTPASLTTPAPPVFPNRFTDFPTGILTNVTTIDPDIQNGEAFQAGFQYERQLSASATASIGYEHLRGRHIIMSRNVNVPTTTDPAVFNLGRPDPMVANNGQFQSVGDSWYNGLTVAFTQRPGRWGSFRASYTYSKAFDTAGNFFFSTPQDNGNIAAERGRSDNDQRHRLTLSGTLNSPVARNGSAWSALAADWSLTGIFTYTSALPYNMVLSFDRNGDTNLNDRPVDVGRNAGRGFDYKSFDLRLARRIPVAEQVELEAILETFNVFNRKNYQGPNNTSGSPTFGAPTAVNDPRQVQLGLRVSF